MVGSKQSFWQALVFTVVVFCMGLAIGFFYETTHNREVSILLTNSEINLFDQQLSSSFLSGSSVSCELAINKTFDFADRIYNEAFILEQYDESTKFTNDLKVLHRRYDLLRGLLWLDAINLKTRCPNHSFSTVVYVYQYSNNEVDIRAKQQFYSRLLLDLKLAHKDQILLIPIASDTDLSSISALLQNYNVSESPSIVLNEEDVISEIIALDELEAMLFNRHN